MMLEKKSIEESIQTRFDSIRNNVSQRYLNIEPSTESYNRVKERLINVIKNLKAEAEMSEIFKRKIYEILSKSTEGNMIFKLDSEKLLLEAVERDVLYKEYSKYLNDAIQTAIQTSIYQKIVSTHHTLMSLTMFLAENIITRLKTNNLMDGAGRLNIPVKFLDVMGEFLKMEKEYVQSSIRNLLSLKEVLDFEESILKEFEMGIEYLERAVEFLDSPNKGENMGIYSELKNIYSVITNKQMMLERIHIDLKLGIKA